jgi:hypothetical protein
MNRGVDRCTHRYTVTWSTSMVADGEQVLDVPAKLSARARVFSTGHGRKTDATDAHSIAVVAVRTPNLNQVGVDDELVSLPLLADRRDELAGARARTVSRLHRLLLELIPAGAPRFLSATQAKAHVTSASPDPTVAPLRWTQQTQRCRASVSRTLRTRGRAPAPSRSTGR